MTTLSLGAHRFSEGSNVACRDDRVQGSATFSQVTLPQAPKPTHPDGVG